MEQPKNTSRYILQGLPSVVDTTADEAELLSSALFEEGNVPVLLSRCTAEDFTCPEYRQAFEGLAKMAGAGVEVNIVGTCPGYIPQAIITKIVADAKGGGAEIGSTYEHHVMLFARKAAQRRAYYEALNTLMLCTQPTEIAFDDLSLASERLARALSLGREGRSLGKSHKEALREYVDWINQPEGRTYGTGIMSLDNLLGGGFTPGHLIISAARPATGKTSSALQFARIQAGLGARVLFISLEMTARECVKRMLCGTDAYGTGVANWADYGIREIENSAITWVDDAVKLDDIVLRIRQFHAQRKADIVYIDYLGLIRYVAEKRGTTRAEDVGQITHTLKGLAKELDIPVVLLAQLNRDSVKTTGTPRDPVLTDLRESGDIEQDADEVLMWGDDLEGVSSEETDYLRLFVRKNRYGRTPAEYIPIRCTQAHARFAQY